MANLAICVEFRFHAMVTFSDYEKRPLWLFSNGGNGGLPVCVLSFCRKAKAYDPNGWTVS
jgi:hypothetical protein